MNRNAPYGAKPENKAKRSRAKAATRQQVAQAVSLRISGLSYDQITTQMGFGSKQLWHYHIQRHLNQSARELAMNTEELRELELSRLDRVSMLYSAKMASKDDKLALSAADGALKVSERRSKLLGLDAATKIQITEREVTGIVLLIVPVLTQQLADLPRERIEAVIAGLEQALQSGAVEQSQIVPPAIPYRKQRGPSQASNAIVDANAL